jgi:hypothetical protein
MTFTIERLSSAEDAVITDHACFYGLTIRHLNQA